MAKKTRTELAQEQTYANIADSSESTLGDVKGFDDETGGKKEIRIAISGLGNCASALLQGVEYYKNIKETDMYINGLMNPSVGGYLPGHIKIVAAFDVNTLKLGTDVAEAIYAHPITTPRFVLPENYPKTGVIVQPGPILDGVAEHMRESF